MAVVLWGSLLPQDTLVLYQAHLPLLGWNDKLLHAGAYFGLAFLAVFAFARRETAKWIALSMILLGGGVEFAQRFSPGRDPDILDEIANSCGVVAGLAVGMALRRRITPNFPR